MSALASLSKFAMTTASCNKHLSKPALLASDLQKVTCILCVVCCFKGSGRMHRAYMFSRRRAAGRQCMPDCGLQQLFAWRKYSML
jgi:hypothetical protein